MCMCVCVCECASCVHTYECVLMCACFYYQNCVCLNAMLEISNVEIGIVCVHVRMHVYMHVCMHV